MTEQQNSTPGSPIEVPAKTYEALVEALGGLENRFEMPQAAREFVKRGAAAAKDRSTDLRAGANKVTGAIEEALVGAVNGMADINRKIGFRLSPCLVSEYSTLGGTCAYTLRLTIPDRAVELSARRGARAQG